METLKLELVVRNANGEVVSSTEIDYVDEYDLDKPSTKHLFARRAAIAVEAAKKRGANLCCPKCGSRAIRELHFNFPRGFCRECKHKATLRYFRIDSSERSAAA